MYKAWEKEGAIELLEMLRVQLKLVDLRKDDRHN